MGVRRVADKIGAKRYGAGAKQTSRRVSAPGPPLRTPRRRYDITKDTNDQR